MTLHSHGRIACTACFPAGSTDFAPHPKWTMRNDPGAWGSANPTILVLGFSKGATQKDIYDTGTFDDIAFGGQETRANLTNILRTARLIGQYQTAADLIRSSELGFAFGSLVRCSCARIDEKESKERGKAVYRTSGALILKSFKEIPRVIETCSRRYIANLPASLRLLCFLGVTDGYIKQCRQLVRGLYPDGFEDIDDVSYKTSRFMCVHLTHPSKGNGTVDAWLNTDVSNPHESSRKKASARKRELAVRVISTCNLES